jgi:hypothetical protein
MSEALSYQFQGSEIGLLKSFDIITAGAITSITAANPPVVTDAAHGRADGDVVIPAGVTGMTQVNGKPFIIEVLTADTFALLGIDASDYTAGTGGTYKVGSFDNFCALTNYQRQGGTADEQETTSLCTTKYKTYKLGLGDPGTTQVDYLFAPVTDLLQARLAELDGSKEMTAFKIVLPDDGGIMVQLGYVQQTSEQAGNGTLWTGSATFRNSGTREDFEAP